MPSRPRPRAFAFASTGWPRAVAALVAALALAAGDARAFVPPVGKIADQVARANRSAGRAQSLVLSVALRAADGDTLAQGELWSDARGVARLELAAGGTVERHLLRGGQHLAARNGARIPDPAPYLPPLFLLQAGNGDRVLSGVLSIGASAEETVLGRHDGEVCYVIGGRDLPPPANESASLVGSPGPKASLWVERESWRIVRVDRLDGTRYVLGPPRDHGDVTLPAWVRVERPGAAPARLEVLSARAGRFDLSGSFGTDWLLGR